MPTMNRFSRDDFRSVGSFQWARKVFDAYDSAIARGLADNTPEGWRAFLDWSVNLDGEEGVRRELTEWGCDESVLQHHDFIVVLENG